ncbi:cytochrome P450 27C1 [Danio rerio]|uniref:Cytochrome P450 27C1 n=1 Tax=Danio rerio TaxID=7955 RepID=C27C1_DANRE|nr:cytochrome P450 27C1 [Danio rerio]A8WGA0.2 RecName: Full=Cytochrome P450 27C1; AltName: Full=All-trans retinol 3,4-desaturase [Danio rerio]|eukprot:NP_001106808.2 cytochrome P450 27C1 [Danio rerio]
MALQSTILHMARKNLLQESCRQLLIQTHGLHKSVASGSLEIAAHSQADLKEESAVSPAEEVQKAARVKSLKEMPGPSTVANLLEFFYRDGFSRIHEIQMEHAKKYGKIFKSRFGPQFVVSIADRDMVAQVLRSESATPQRGNMESWKEYRDLRGRSTGLISAEGDEWLKMRSVLRQLIMRPRDVAVFSSDVNDVVADLVKRVKTLRSQQDDSQTVLNINDLFFKYAMEGVATILYETRLGCLENEIPKMSQEYITALHLMFSSFKTTMYAGAIPKWLRPIIPKPWEEFCSSWDGLFKFSQIHVDKRLSEIKKQMEKSEEIKGGLLTHMLVTREMNLEEIYANMTEMLLAGVDTTSFTLSWSTYLLARHPTIQQQIFEEVDRVLGGRVPTGEDVPYLPLIRGLVKETLRLFPVLPGNGRVTHDDLIVGGYLIPKGTQLALCHYSTSMDEENFPRPEEFRPDRWIRKDASDRVDNFGSIPFGYGIRSCIGRRIAELEMHLALTQLLQNFHIEVSPQTTEVHAKTHGLLCPGASINLRFTDRK